MMQAEELSNAHLLIGAVAGLGTCVSGLACLLFHWLRDDIRSLAEKEASTAENVSDLKESHTRLVALLEGKGVIPYGT